MLVERINEAGNGDSCATFPEIVEYLKQNASGGDLILTIGAGNVCDVAPRLCELGQPG